MGPPLYEKMRPKTLDDITGQEHLTGINGISDASDCVGQSSVITFVRSTRLCKNHDCKDVR